MKYILNLKLINKFLAVNSPSQPSPKERVSRPPSPLGEGWGWGCLLFFFFLFLLPLISSAATLSRAPNNLGLVGYWKFDEGVGIKAGDFSGHGNHGTITGATWTSGKLGKALSFDGANNYVLKSSMSGDFTNGGSVSFWTYNNSLTNLDGFIATSQILPLIYVNGTNIRATVYNSVGGAAFDAAGSTIPLGQWVFYTIVWDTSSLKIYKNGSNVDGQDTSITGTLRTSAGNLYIGNDRDSAGRTVDGKLDDVRIYNRALSASEIQKLYKSGAAKFNSNSAEMDDGSSLERGLVGHWTFDGKDTNWRTNQTYDKSGKGNHGTMTNMSTTSSPAIGKLGQGLSFTSDYVTVPYASSLNLPTVVTISAWINARSIINSDTIAFRGNNYALQLYDSGGYGGVKFVFYSGSWREAISSDFLQTNKWYHVAAVFDETTNVVRFYVNGSLDSLPAMTYDMPNADTNDLIIGDTGGAEYFNGILDDIRIYNRALSATEIKQLYNMGR